MAKVTTIEGSRYSMHPGFSMEEASIRNLHKQTGKTLDEWIEIVKRSGYTTEKEQAAWLRTEHGIGTNTAGWIAERAAGKSIEYYPDEYVEKMFEKKQHLRPIYDALLELAFELGPDVNVTPCSTMVPFRRKFVFAQVKPSTKTRVDLGLALKDTRAIKPLIDTGGLAKGDRITHRIELTSVEDITDEVKAWLRQAYDMCPPL
jgi:hypothetical protein